MSDLLSKSFSSETELGTFIVEWLPKIVKEHGEVSAFSEVDPIVSVWNKDDNARYSIQVFRDGSCVVEEREMIDFPLFTLVIKEETWPTLRPFLGKWVPVLVDRIEAFKGEFFLDRKKMKELERIDATISMTVTHLDGDKGRSASFQLILNDYKPVKNSAEFSVSISEEGLWSVVNEDFTIEKLTQAMRIGGQIGLSVRIGHILSK